MSASYVRMSILYNRPLPCLLSPSQAPYPHFVSMNPSPEHPILFIRFRILMELHYQIVLAAMEFLQIPLLWFLLCILLKPECSLLHPFLEFSLLFWWLFGRSRGFEGSNSTNGFMSANRLGMGRRNTTHFLSTGRVWKIMLSHHMRSHYLNKFWEETLSPWW